MTTSASRVAGYTECLEWAAILFSTAVQDADRDGLLDVWESTAGGAVDVTDPFGAARLPDLKAMGADPAKPDVFVEIDYLNAPGSHRHLPTRAALDSIGDAFKAKGVQIHFDVGPNYQPAGATPADPYIVPAASGRGGDAILESSITCVPSAGKTCLFPNFPGTVNWKTDFSILKSQYFDSGRKDIFRYALFAHALGMPAWRINDRTLLSVSTAAGVTTVTTAAPHNLGPGAFVAFTGARSNSRLSGAYTVAGVSGANVFYGVNPGRRDGIVYELGPRRQQRSTAQHVGRIGPSGRRHFSSRSGFGITSSAANSCRRQPSCMSSGTIWPCGTAARPASRTASRITRAS